MKSGLLELRTLGKRSVEKVVVEGKHAEWGLKVDEAVSIGLMSF